MSAGSGLKQALGFWDLVLFGLICITPMAPFTLFGFVSAASGGAVILPYVLGSIGLGLTALSYAAMVEVAPQAGSVYGFGRLAMGRFVGFLGGWAIMLDYVVICALVLLYGAIYLNSVVPAFSVEAIIAVFACAMLAVNLLGIHWSAWVDATLTGAQVIVGVVFVVAALLVLTGPTGGGLTLAPLWPEGLALDRLAAATPVAVIAFLGFDAVSTLSEEVRGGSPGEVIGRATLAALALMLALFATISWLLADLSRTMTIADPSTAALEILGARLGWLVTPFSLIVAFAFWAGIAAIHAGVSRLGFAMAREGELPRMLAYVHPARQVPTATVVLYGLLIAITAYFALPHVDLLAGMVSFGAIVAFILVNASVIAHFGIRGGSRHWVRHWVAPSLGIVVLIWVLSGINALSVFTGLAWLALGILWHVIRRATQRLVRVEP